MTRIHIGRIGLALLLAAASCMASRGQEPADGLPPASGAEAYPAAGPGALPAPGGGGPKPREDVAQYVRSFLLKMANPKELEATLRELERGGLLDSTTVKVTVDALGTHIHLQSNSTKSLDNVETLLKQLDRQGKNTEPAAGAGSPPPAGGASRVRPPAAVRPGFPTEGANQIKIFTLQNADATAIVNILDHFFGGVNLAADERTNSVIAEGAEERLAVVEAILLKLDEQPSPHENSGGAGLPPSRSKSRFVEGGTGMYPGMSGGGYPGGAVYPQAGAAAKKSNQQAIETAQRYRQLEADGKRQQLDELKKKLLAEVDSAFQARQDSQRAELAQLAQRLRRIEQMIAAREKIRDRIIDRRVEELLNPELRWPEAPPAGAAPAGPGMSTGMPGGLPPSYDSGSSSRNVPAATGAGPGNPSVAAPPAAPSDLLVIRRRAALTGERLERVRSLAEAGRATPAERDEAEAAAAVAEAELAAAEQRFETEGRLLALDLRKAMSDFETATKELKAMEQIADGAVAGNKVEQLRKAVLEAHYALKRAEIRMNAHLAAAGGEGTDNGDAGQGEPPDGDSSGGESNWFERQQADLLRQRRMLIEDIAGVKMNILDVEAHGEPPDNGFMSLKHLNATLDALQKDLDLVEQKLEVITAAGGRMVSKGVPASAAPGSAAATGANVAAAAPGDVQVLRSKVAAAQAKFKRMAQLAEDGVVTAAELTDVEASVAVALAELAAAERRYQEQTRLLELDRQEAGENLNAAQRELKVIEQAYRANEIGVVEYNRARNKVVQAEFAFNRAEIRWQAHRAAAEFVRNRAETRTQAEGAATGGESSQGETGKGEASKGDSTDLPDRAVPAATAKPFRPRPAASSGTATATDTTPSSNKTSAETRDATGTPADEK